jgi:hypothetical protein
MTTFHHSIMIDTNAFYIASRLPLGKSSVMRMGLSSRPKQYIERIPRCPMRSRLSNASFHQLPIRLLYQHLAVERENSPETRLSPFAFYASHAPTLRD